MKPIQYSFFKTRKEIKDEANEDLSHSWKEAVLVNVITKIIPKLLILLVSAFIFVGLFWEKWYKDLGAKRWIEPYSWQQKFYLNLRWTESARGWLIVLLVVLVLVYIPLRYGKERYFLLSAQNDEQVEFKEIFSGFKKIFKILGIEFQRQWPNLISVISFYLLFRFFTSKNSSNILSTLLLIVAVVFLLIGLWHCYRLKMAFRIEVDNPEMDSDDICEKSVKLMDKRIISYILLYISFVPFLLLGILTIFIWDLKLSTQIESSNAFFYLDLL